MADAVWNGYDGLFNDLHPPPKMGGNEIGLKRPIFRRSRVLSLAKVLRRSRTRLLRARKVLKRSRMLSRVRDFRRSKLSSKGRNRSKAETRLHLEEG